MVNSGDVVSSGEIVIRSNTLDIRGPLLQDMWQRQASERSGLSSFVFSSSADVHDITFYTPLVHNSHKWLLGEKLICPPAKYAICYWFLKCCVKQCSIMTWLDKVSALWFLKEQCYSFSLLHESLEQFVKFVSSVRSSNSHPDLLLTPRSTPLFQTTPDLNTGLSLSEPLQLYKGYNAI